MFNFASSLRIHLCLEAVDMRKSFNGLYAMAKHEMGHNPMNGDLYVFSNRRRDRVKILYWDGSGFWVLAKRLDEARQRGDGASPEGVRKAGALWAD
ncbi:MAG: IS66 family insertion sequence element accessory protein TnpB [Opitutales bacterium]|nr:IS66 family insertion sequence element accessory protein TnpB [Opitutales bacterium]